MHSSVCRWDSASVRVHALLTPNCSRCPNHQYPDQSLVALRVTHSRDRLDRRHRRARPVPSSWSGPNQTRLNGCVRVRRPGAYGVQSLTWHSVGGPAGTPLQQIGEGCSVELLSEGRLLLIQVTCMRRTILACSLEDWSRVVGHPSKGTLLDPRPWKMTTADHDLEATTVL